MSTPDTFEFTPSCLPGFLFRTKKNAIPASARTAIATPTPIPAFAPVLKPLDVPGLSFTVVDDGVAELRIVGTTDKLGVKLEETLDDDVDVVSALRTRNPGLDRSPLFWSKVGEDALNRKTYFALTARLLSGIAIVQAKLPGELMLIFSKHSIVCQ
jgi:hypothetical protein